MIYLELFWCFFQIGLFSVGGGNAAFPLIQHHVVDVHPWLTLSQFADVIAISEMTPGPIAINAATFIGIRVAGVPGAVIATVGWVLPSCCIVLLLAFFYYRFRGLDIIQGVLSALRPAVVALLASAGVSLAILAFYGQRELPTDLSDINIMAVGIFVTSLFALRKWKISPVFVILGAGLVSIFLRLFS